MSSSLREGEVRKRGGDKRGGVRGLTKRLGNNIFLNCALQNSVEGLL